MIINPQLSSFDSITGESAISPLVMTPLVPRDINTLSHQDIQRFEPSFKLTRKFESFYNQIQGHIHQRSEVNY